MISIIICNRKPLIDLVLAENICNTIGVEYEIISIDNSNGQYSIFQAYNEGERRANGDILCFMHDDVLFKTRGWGAIVERIFSGDDKIGALGVDGGHFMPDCPCSWTSCYITSFHIWRDDKGDVCREYSNTEFANGQRLVEVASIDGLWMCIRRSLFDAIRFDDKTFTGFHCYDSDICMQIIESGYHIQITYDVDIIHNSDGTYNPQFFESIELWHKKWHHLLPIVRGIELSEKEQMIHQRYAIELLERQKETVYLYSKLHSQEYRLGHFLLKPYRFIKRALNRE